MSQPVDLAVLRQHITEHGNHPFLITVSEGGAAHVVSASVAYDGDQLEAGAGRTTRANVERNPSVTLLWPTGPDPAYSLIVDAVGTVDDESGAVVLVPISAILHRVAGSGEGPACLPLAR